MDLISFCLKLLMIMSNVSIELDRKLVVDGILDKSTNQSEFGKIMSSFQLSKL